MPELQSLLIFFASFVLVCIASREIGHFLGKYNLPHITGYLLAGALAGPFLLGMLPESAIEELRFVDQLSLAVIAFIAGSELYLKELRSRIRPIMLNVTGVVIAAFIGIGVALFILTETIPFIQEMIVNGTIDATGRIAIALLGATVLLALSPPSTIAVIQEVRARGQFTRTVLSTTVVMDVIIITLFAISAALAGSLLRGDPLTISFAGLLLLDLVLAVGVGYLIGRLLALILVQRWRMSVKMALVLFIGWGVFAGGALFRAFAKETLGLDLHVESLLVAMIAGFYMTNYSGQRDAFDGILHTVSPWVYVAFFTLTGIGLKLDILLAGIGVALLLFLVRMAAIYVGSFGAMTLAQEPPRFRRLYGLGLVTQAGIALGLAREVSVQFPNTLGAEFATLIISVVVLNEIFGPLLLKYALRQAGEANEPERVPLAPHRAAVILGIEPQSVTLARQLSANDWRVIVADTDESQVERMAAEDVDERYIPEISEQTLAGLLDHNTDALVAMMEDDVANLRACRIAQERYGVRRLIVRPNQRAHADDFAALGAIVIDPGSAMVTLLDPAVRAPQSAALMMHTDPEYDIVQITVTEPGIDGMMVRDLRLPNDVLILEIARNGHSLVPNGYTIINQEDDITLIGKPESLREATLKLGY